MLDSFDRLLVWTTRAVYVCSQTKRHVIGCVLHGIYVLHDFEAHSLRSACALIFVFVVTQLKQTHFAFLCIHTSHNRRDEGHEGCGRSSSKDDEEGNEDKGQGHEEVEDPLKLAMPILHTFDRLLLTN